MVAEPHFKADPSDFIVLVMGPPGSGKSNFINTLTGSAEQRRAGNLTQDVTPYIVSYHGLRLVLVDTPGFDNTYLPDSEVLRKIADFLTQNYQDGTTIRVAGIIYFHRITDKQMSGSVYKCLQIFSRICGDMPLRRTRLVTTMWDQVTNREVAADRERQLAGGFWQKPLQEGEANRQKVAEDGRRHLTGDLWSPQDGAVATLWQRLLQEGAVAERFDNTQHRAFEIVDELISLGPDGDKLLLQEELVEQHKRLNETEAAKVLYSRFQQLLVEQKKTLKDLADEAKLANDPALAKCIQEEYDKINVQLQKTFEEMEVMKTPLSRRISLWPSGGKSRTQAWPL